MGVSAGDAFLDVHSRLAADFNRRLAAQVQNPAKRAGEEASRHFGRRFAAGLAIGGAIIGAGLVKGIRLAVREVGKAVQRASDLNETLSKSEHIFGRNAKAIQQWARGSVSAMGLTRNQAIGNAAAFGDMFRQLGLGLNPATRMSKRMVELSADLASFSNADISDVLNAQQSAFRGEYDALQRFIPNINAARVQQEALRLTHKKSAKDLTAAEKAQATYAIMLRDSSRAQGDFARTAGEQANQQRIAKARLEEISTTVGKFFLPGVLRVTRAVNSFLLPALQDLAEKHGPRVEQVFTRLGGTVAKALQGVDLERFVGQGVAKLEQIGPKVADAIDRIGKRLGETRSQVRPAGGEVSRLATALNLGGAALDFIGGHMDLVVKALPVLVAGFLAYKAAQALANLASIAQVALLPLQIAGSFTLAKANRALAASNREMAAGTAVSTAAQTAANTAGKAGLLTSIRARAATLAQAAASKVAGLASKAWAAAQWLLNVALTANPIGLVIAAVALLVAGIVIAYKKSETFRRIVHTVWDAVKGKIATAVNFILGLLRGWLNFQLAMVAGILHVMGKLPGPMGAPFRAAEKAVRDAKRTVNEQLDKIQARVNRLRGKDIPISASLKLNFSSSFTQKDWVQVRLAAGRMAGGGLVREGTTATADDVIARLSRGEYVLRAAAVDAIGVDRLNQLNAMRFAGGGPVGAIEDETRAINKVQARGTGVRMDRGMTKLLAAFGAHPPHAAGGWRFALDFLRRLGIAFSVISTFRPGARTHASGAVSFHALNRAVDVVGDLPAVFAALSRTDPTELIWSHASRYKSRSGWHPIGQLDPVTFMDHLGHLHAAYKRGGLVMDSGGYLMPGWNPPMYNGTGRPERVGGDGAALLDPRSARMIGRAVADELKAAGIGATYLDSRRAEQVLAGAAVSNRRR